MSADLQDYSKDIPLVTSYNGQYRNSQGYFQSPLLPTPKNFERNGSSNNQQFSNHNGIRSRLGRKTFNNPETNIKQNHNRNDNFNRKRNSTNNEGPNTPKRKWRNRQPFYQQANSSNQTNSAQKRLNVIRNTQTQKFQEPQSIENCQQEFVENANDSQEFDATDITVEVINHNAQCQDDSQYPIKFKMVLDPKTQAAIKVIQQKRKDKQVIFPFPVTPNVTGISLHERFTML